VKTNQLFNKFMPSLRETFNDFIQIVAFFSVPTVIFGALVGIPRVYIHIDEYFDHKKRLWAIQEAKERDKK
jgi:hypothetical protein